MTHTFLDDIERRRVFDLAQPMHAAMPQRRSHAKFFLALFRRHGDSVRSSGLTFANETLSLSGHSGTHMDALAHASLRGRLHGGAPTETAQSPEGMRTKGIETASLLVARFVIYDLARKHRGPLPPGYAIAADELRSMSTDMELMPSIGDVALVRTGWGALWGDPVRYEGKHGGIPGIDLSAAEWFGELGVRAIGADNFAVEVESEKASDLHVHAHCLVERGIYLLENLFLEELGAASAYQGLLIAAPLKIVGATASPIRPIAIV